MKGPYEKAELFRTVRRQSRTGERTRESIAVKLMKR
jgi:hypothetical protein